MKKLIEALQDKNNRKAYVLAKTISAESAASNKYYPCFDDFLSLLAAGSSYVQVRGFALCCAQAKWDNLGKLQNALCDMLKLLQNDKPTVVRQCLRSLHEVIRYRPELCNIIEMEIECIDVSKYKDSMAPLIQKDIMALMKLLK